MALQLPGSFLDLIESKDNDAGGILHHHPFSSLGSEIAMLLIIPFYPLSLRVRLQMVALCRYKGVGGRPVAEKPTWARR